MVKTPLERIWFAVAVMVFVTVIYGPALGFAILIVKHFSGGCP